VLAGAGDGGSALIEDFSEIIESGGAVIGGRRRRAR
jgi:hypothetical protein